MTELKAWYTAKELAGLPGMPESIKGVIGWDKKARIAGRDRDSGKGREYAYSSLPEETRQHLSDLAKKAANLPAAVEAPLPATTGMMPAPLPAPATLKQWQRECMDARVAFMRLIERARAVGKGMEECLADLVSASQGRIPEIVELARRANKRSGCDRGVSKSSLYRWWLAWEATKDATVLAPKDTEDTALPTWAPEFLSLYCVPQKPSVAACLEDMARNNPTACPSKDQIYRFLKKYSSLDILKGRMSGAELARHTPFTRRDTSKLLPMQVCVVDGHSFKAKVAHPKHGRPFAPEVCAVLDAATRMIVGWSAGLAESNETVADAVRHALTVNADKPQGGMITILYSDKGAGNTAAVNADPVLGRFVRLGMTLETGRAGNPRGRGLIEIVNKTVWIPMAKKLPTYNGKDMDSLVERKVYLHLQSTVRAARKEGVRPESRAMIPWQLFLAALVETVERYNNRPHSSLEKIRCPQTGKMRHMAPREAWAKHMGTGWQPEIIAERELADMFRPQVTVTTRNGEVRLFGNIYFNRDLQHYHKRQVIVEYEVQDGSQVWVRDMEHRRLICTAGFEANKRAYFAKSATDQAEENRRKNRLTNVDRRRDEIEAEYHGIAPPVVIQHPPELVEARRALIMELSGQQQPALPGPEGPAQPRPKVVSFEEKGTRQRYKHYKEMKQRLADGETIPEEDYRRLLAYEQSAECKSWMNLEEHNGKVFAGP